jgi:hypothetical protein
MTMPRLSFCVPTSMRHAAFVLPLSLLALSSAYAEPNLASVTPRGLQIGGTTRLVLAGSDLPDSPTIVLGAPIASQQVRSQAANRLEVEVTLDEAASPGIYALRVAGRTGISNPVLVGLDRLPQQTFRNELTTLPGAWTGTIDGAQVLSAQLRGQRGQRLVLDVEARRLGSGLSPVVRLYDPRGTQIAFSPPRATLGGDARLEATLPADGMYTVELHDELFRPQRPGFFRLKAGPLDYADLVVPLAVTLGTRQEITYRGTHLHASATVDATGEQAAGERPAPVPTAEWFTGAAPRILYSDLPERVEAASDGAVRPPQELGEAPVAVSGVLSQPGEEDRYLLVVRPRQRLRLEVTARQFNSPLDAVLIVRRPEGQELARGDDRPGSSDPLVNLNVPAGVTKVELIIKDLLGRGGRDFVYRIVAQDAGAPDFALSLATDRIQVPAGGTQVVPVQVTRSNYSGPIELRLEPHDAALTLLGQIIPEGATIGLLTLSAAAEAPPHALRTRLVGTATAAGRPLVRIAQGPEAAALRYQPHLRTELGLAITEPAPLRLVWQGREDDRLLLGDRLPVAARIERTGAAEGKVRLKLLTSQPTPKKTLKEGNQNKVVDDLERTLRLEGDNLFDLSQSEVTTSIRVPHDLPRQPWDLVLVAELLTPDAKRVLTSVAAPVRTLTPVVPVRLELTSPAEAEGRVGLGPVGQFSGRVDRQKGFTQPVVVMLENLPAGYLAPQVLVPPEQDAFHLPLRFAFGNQPAELNEVKLVAVAAPVTARSVRSEPIPVKVNLLPGEKPSLEPPRELFEDDEAFAGLLTEGNGRAIPDQREAYRGKYALRVTPDQRFRANLPSLGVKIRENPGPGEYRYLRFAWRKVQGNAICLQLAHDGQFGPGGSGRPGASFRYHAGPADESYGAALRISDTLPASYEVVTRDLFLDFGEFTLTGLGFSAIDGQSALFDHIYLARQLDDFALIPMSPDKQP